MLIRKKICVSRSKAFCNFRVPLKIEDTKCYPVFLCLHSKSPGSEQLKKDISRYRSTKQVPKQLFIEGHNYKASDKWLHSKLFSEKAEGLRMISEYTNVMFLSISSEDILKRFARERTKIAELNAFHDKLNTLPLSGRKKSNHVTIQIFCGNG